MEWKYPALIIILIGFAVITGCTETVKSPAATTPVPVTVAPAVPETPGPYLTTALPVTTARWTPETPSAGNLYTQTLSFHGSGDYDELTFTTERDATWVIDLTYPREGIFSVILKNGHGEEIRVLANEGGAGTSRKTVSLKAGDYYFDIKAGAPWYITMKTG